MKFNSGSIRSALFRVQNSLARGPGLKGAMSASVTRARIYEGKLKRKENAARRRALIRQAAYTKGVARKMLVQGGKQPNKPGGPPRLRGGSKLFRNSVHWGWNKNGAGVGGSRGYSVAGPVQLTNRNVPGALGSGGISGAVVQRKSANTSYRKSKLARTAQKSRRRGSGEFLKFTDKIQKGPKFVIRQKTRKHPFMQKAMKITNRGFAAQFRGAFR